MFLSKPALAADQFYGMPPTKSRRAILLISACAVAASAIRINTPASVYERHEGVRLDLPCKVVGLRTEPITVEWWKNYSLVSFNKRLVDPSHDPRLAVNSNGIDYTLSISSLNGSDSGDYKCSVVRTRDFRQKASITHNLRVLGMSSIFAFTEQLTIRTETKLR